MLQGYNYKGFPHAPTPGGGDAGFCVFTAPLQGRRMSGTALNAENI